MTVRCRPVVLSVLIAAVASAGPATAPGVGAPDRSAMGEAIRRLADPEPAVRDAARTALMGVDGADLQPLRDAIAAARPLRPAQIDALRSVVTYALTRVAVLRIGTQGEAFLGVQLADSGQFDDGDDQPLGVLVVLRVPGFVAARYLEDGDRILGLGLGGQTIWVRSRQQLINVVSTQQPGTPLTVYVQRAGQATAVTLPLDSRPRVAGAPRGDDMQLINNLTAQAETAAQAATIAEFSKTLGVSTE